MLGYSGKAIKTVDIATSLLQIMLRLKAGLSLMLAVVVCDPAFFFAYLLDTFFLVEEDTSRASIRRPFDSSVENRLM